MAGKAIALYAQGMAAFHDILSAIPGVGGTSEAAAGVSSEGEMLNSEERAAALGEAAVEVGVAAATSAVVPLATGHGPVVHQTTHAMEAAALRASTAVRYRDMLNASLVTVVPTAGGRHFVVATRGGQPVTSYITRRFNPNTLLPGGTPRWIPTP